MARFSITPVILCGGSGTRLWPRSRPAMPKPFLALVADRTLFQEALLRCTDKQLFNKAVVVIGAAHVQLVEAQAAGVHLGEIIVEPIARQTAAAVALAAMRLPENTVMLVCPTDHHVEDTASFREAAAFAAELAVKGWLVCIAVSPSAPDTCYGYVQRGPPLDAAGYRVSKFVEKPDQATAAAYVRSGEFAWNAGIFAFRAGDYVRELERFRPALAAAVRRSVADGEEVEGQFHPGAAAFAKVEPESLDCAVMENTDRAAMVMAQMAWSDVGSWLALHAIREKDSSNNSVRGEAELVDCRNVLVDSNGPRVHVIGLEDALVVVDGNDVLVASTRNSERIAVSLRHRTDE